MNLLFTPNAWDDYRWWVDHDRAVLRRLNRILDETLRDPFSGIGKPEPLKHELEGAWSRRITQEHRLVYVIEKDRIIVLQARYHYR